MRPNACWFGHAWQEDCWCQRCGARNPHADLRLDVMCRCVRRGMTYHAVVHDRGEDSTSASGHTCARCWTPGAHRYRTERRFVDIGAWDVDMGPYEIEERYEVCDDCGCTSSETSETGYRRYV